MTQNVFFYYLLEVISNLSQKEASYSEPLLDYRYAALAIKNHSDTNPRQPVQSTLIRLNNVPGFTLLDLE